MPIELSIVLGEYKVRYVYPRNGAMLLFCDHKLVYFDEEAVVSCYEGEVEVESPGGIFFFDEHENSAVEQTHLFYDEDLSQDELWEIETIHQLKVDKLTFNFPAPSWAREGEAEYKS